jgi:hypothetical protein
VGNFIDDWAGVPEPIVDAITPEGLDRAALESCVGGAFFPGIEVGWLIRKKAVYAEPFRVNRGASVGALRVEPGFFSQQMAQPWQADFYACQRERYQGTETFHAWWPAQRPDDVFLEGHSGMVPWARFVPPGSEEEQYKHMVEFWWRGGFVIREGIAYLEREAGE